MDYVKIFTDITGNTENSNSSLANIYYHDSLGVHFTGDRGEAEAFIFNHCMLVELGSLLSWHGALARPNSCA